MHDFVHLHVHSQYSLLDGQASIARLVDKAIADGQQGLALTDHGNMFGVKEFWNYIKKKNSDRRSDIKKAKTKIDERLLTAYNRIRRSVRNGLAVVTVKRDACGGCFNRIPPQRQVDIRQGKKLIVCEYCGRILVSE